MSKKAYIGISNKARKVSRIYVGVAGKARKVVKAYVGVAGKARQFWPSVITKIYSIFSNGAFDAQNVLTTVDIENHVKTTSGDISTLSNYFGTDNTLWVKKPGVMENWSISSDKNIISNYDDYTQQMVKNSIYIPIKPISNPESLHIIARGNLIYKTGYIDNGQMIESSNKGYICSDIFVDRTVDVSTEPKIDYIRIGSPEVGPISELSDETIMRSYLDPGDPVEQWELSAKGWVQHFTNPISISNTCEEYTIWTETPPGGEPWNAGVGLKDFKGEGNVYTFYYSNAGYSDYSRLYLYAISDKPFTCRYLYAEDSNDGRHWSEYEEDCDMVTHFNKTYYYAVSICMSYSYSVEELAPFISIEYGDTDSYFTSFDDLNYRGIWTAAYIILGGVIRGGSLHQIQKIEVIGDI